MSRRTASLVAVSVIALGALAFGPARAPLGRAGEVVLGLLGVVPDEPAVESLLAGDAEVERFVAVFTGEGKPWLETGLKNAARYVGEARAEMARQGVPACFAWLPLIESGFDPLATSWVGARGLWQFMPETGAGYGLRIDGAVDERLDPVRATAAAARHLRELYDRFGDWALALAAYNAGAGYVGQLLEKTKARSFRELAPHLYPETRDYVPRFLAAYRIARDPHAHGLSAAIDGEATPVRVLARGGSLDALARAWGVEPAAAARLNPHLKARQVPETSGGYAVLLPASAAPVDETVTLVVRGIVPGG